MHFDFLSQRQNKNILKGPPRTRHFVHTTFSHFSWLLSHEALHPSLFLSICTYIQLCLWSKLTQKRSQTQGLSGLYGEFRVGVVSWQCLRSNKRYKVLGMQLSGATLARHAQGPSLSLRDCRNIGSWLRGKQNSRLVPCNSVELTSIYRVAAVCRVLLQNPVDNYTLFAMIQPHQRQPKNRPNWISECYR